jgi:single-stranded DNA-specific DHH superfamily exonuclease
MQHENRRDSESGVDPAALDELMGRIGQDMQAQELLLNRDPSAAEKAAELLAILREAKSRLERLVHSLTNRQEGGPA